MLDFISLRADAASALEELLRGFRPEADRRTLLEQGERISLGLHLIAVATLLVDGNAQGFLLNLCRMAENGRRLLSLLRARGEPPPPARKNGPLLAALAAGQLELAGALATLWETPRQEEEYAGEYLWASVLQQLARGVPSRARALELLGALEREGGAGYENRATAARALLARDLRAWTEAFEAARLDYQLETEKRARAFGTPVTTFAPHRFLWLEGLALLRLGARAGMPLTHTDHAYCPPLARLPLKVPFPADWLLPWGDPWSPPG